jgi:hypothetical protein
MSAAYATIPPETAALRLCKMKGEDLILCERVRFPGGVSAVDTTLRRAAISGQVGPVGETGDYWADILDENGDLIETVGLDRDTYSSLKNRWMRCKVEASK